MMKYYDIYMEGYSATGQSCGAQHIGSAEGETFREAVMAFSRTDEAKGYGSFYEKDLSFWGCRCYPSLSDAAKSFG